MEKINIYWLKGFTPLLLSLLGACGSAPVVPAFTFDAEPGFGEQPAIISETQIHQLTPSQKQAFLDYFATESRQDVSAHRRVAEYVKLKADYFNFVDASLPAEQTLRLARGNCLSLAILTTAFAQLAGVDTRYESLGPTANDQLYDAAVVNTLHVRGILVQEASNERSASGRSIFNETNPRITSRSNTSAVLDTASPSTTAAGQNDIYVDFAARYCSSFAQGGVQDLSYQDYLAAFYLNLAAEAINQQDFADAYWLTRKSLDHAPYNSNAFNYLALVHHRVGEDAKAELIYQYGIENLGNKPGFLKNYQALLIGQGRFEEAEAIDRQITSLGDSSQSR